MGSALGGELLDDNSPMMWAGSRMNRAYQFAGQLERIRARQAKIEAETYQGMLDGTYAPVVRFTDGTTDVAALLAKKLVRAGLTDVGETEAEHFLTARQADYEHAIATRHLPANSLTSACAYWIESVYAVGGGVHASNSDIDGIRATCALTIGTTEKSGALTTNEERYTIGRALAMIGATFRTLAAQSGDTTSAVSGARAMFQSNFGYAIESVPISRFACVLSQRKMSDCDTIMSRYAARLPEIARRNT